MALADSKNAWARSGNSFISRLNLAVHGLEGEIKHGGNINSYYDDPHDATSRFDFVLANPPFNVNAVDKERLKDMVSNTRTSRRGSDDAAEGVKLAAALALAHQKLAGVRMVLVLKDESNAPQHSQRRMHDK